MSNHPRAKLKPCPFCGSDCATVRLYSVGMYYAECIDCGVETLTQGSVAQARAAWNSRAKDGKHGDNQK